MKGVESGGWIKATIIISPEAWELVQLASEQIEEQMNQKPSSRYPVQNGRILEFLAAEFLAGNQQLHTVIKHLIEGKQQQDESFFEHQDQDQQPGSSHSIAGVDGSIPPGSRSTDQAA